MKRSNFRREVDDLTHSIIKENSLVEDSFIENKKSPVQARISIHSLDSEIEKLKTEKSEILKHFEVFSDFNKTVDEINEDPYIGEEKIVNEVELSMLEDEKSDLLEQEIKKVLKYNRRKMQILENEVSHKLKSKDVFDFSRSVDRLIENQVNFVKNDAKELRLSVQRRRYVKYRGEIHKRIVKDLKRKKKNMDKFMLIEQKLKYLKNSTIPMLKSKI